MRYRNCLQILLLSLFIGLLACTQNTGLYKDILNERNKCARNCLKETNDVLRIQCYTKTIEKNPDNPQLYFKRGETYRETFKYTSAISDFIKVIELEPGNTDAYYALAGTASLAYKKEYALHWLEKALESGFDNYRRISEDPSLDNIRQSKRFKSLLEKWGYEISASTM